MSKQIPSVFISKADDANLDSSTPQNDQCKDRECLVGQSTELMINQKELTTDKVGARSR